VPNLPRMSVDRLLNTVLGLYRSPHDAAKTEQILGTTTTLFTTLTNPLNLTLLLSHFLAAPAIWRHPGGLRTSLRVLSIFNAAAINVRRRELESATHAQRSRRWGSSADTDSGLDVEAWTRAVVKGADERSRRWQHLLVLTGVLMGLEGDDHSGTLSGSLRRTLENAIVTAANLALEENNGDGTLAEASILLALNYAFPLLSDGARAEINSDALLSVGMDGLIGSEGVEHDAVFLQVESYQKPLHWPSSSPSFQRLLDVQQKPLIQSLGPLSRLLSYAMTTARDANVVIEALYTLETFTARLQSAWAASPLSGIEDGEMAERECLTPETRQQTWPVLWETLRKLLYAVVAMLQAVVARMLLDQRMRTGPLAAQSASRVLLTLRHLYHISSRKGYSAFQVYDFTYLTAIDILVRDSDACSAFLKSILPPDRPGIPNNPMNRTLDLYYLNTVEHLPLSLSPELNEALIIRLASRYLASDLPPTLGSPLLAALYESAHAATLSVLSCPHNAVLTARLAPSYAETLFVAFPTRITPRQFRLAFRTLMQILSPPFPIYATHPALAETLLEMVRFRALQADLRSQPFEAAVGSVGGTGPGSTEEVISEQAALVLTLIDALPFLSLPIVEDWMTLTAKTMHHIADPAMRELARGRFWDVLVSGEMDVERAALGVAWWGTKGGRELVLLGVSGPDSQEKPMMSGAIVEGAAAERGKL
jgi:hypothetical protein